ncbi:collagen alpha-1(I) chain-like [Mesocricetus auratus]|uniref:Collagen alpha-1(I) chain-like n=1 Tax=Mesocricetus auratus TaxID=10036 RepID=A0ABM2W2U7_MESAU|nr:collagen alpha-1(I) chain-like [Mesocricetus auratus]
MGARGEGGRLDVDGGNQGHQMRRGRSTRGARGRRGEPGCPGFVWGRRPPGPSPAQAGGKLARLGGRPGEAGTAVTLGTRAGPCLPPAPALPGPLRDGDAASSVPTSELNSFPPPTENVPPRDLSTGAAQQPPPSRPRDHPPNRGCWSRLAEDGREPAHWGGGLAGPCVLIGSQSCQSRPPPPWAPLDWLASVPTRDSACSLEGGRRRSGLGLRGVAGTLCGPASASRGRTPTRCWPAP